jgi:hypothetical protein
MLFSLWLKINPDLAFHPYFWALKRKELVKVLVIDSKDANYQSISEIISFYLGVLTTLVLQSGSDISFHTGHKEGPNVFIIISCWKIGHALLQN